MFIKIFLLYLVSFFNLISKNFIDVVIPCHKNDSFMIEDVINGAKNNIMQIRDIIVISETQFTNSAKYFDESLFPFNKDKIKNIFEKKISRPLNQKENNRIGWYYQQLLKFYAPFIIPEVSENVLILDADTVFLRKTIFINDKQEALYATSSCEYHEPYFEHIKLLLPSLKKQYKFSGITHHMLFQKKVLKQLFEEVENLHKKPFWMAFCETINPKFYYDSGASEYELYFNFVLARNKNAKIRELKWINSAKFNFENSQFYDYISCHNYLRS